MAEDIGKKVALITGGSRGIGLAAAGALLELGFSVEICSRSTDAVDRAVGELARQHPQRVAGKAVDVRSRAEVEAWIDEAAQRHGRIDCLINSAGIGRFAAVDSLDPEDWEAVIDTNLKAPFYATRAVVPWMKKQGSGWIFNIASLAGRNPFAGGAAYNASKFGLVGFSEASMLDLRAHGIRVAAILPGSVATDFSHPQPSADDAWKLQPEDVARTLVDLLRYPDRALPSIVELRPSRPPR